MSQTDNGYLFTPQQSQMPLTTRKVHIRRLYDLMQLCIHRNDLRRAVRAWSILARCKEISWMALWSTGLLLVATGIPEEERNPKRIEYLRTMMLRNSNDRQHIFQELIIQLILLGCYKEALEELELYLPSFPYQDNPVFHVLAGLVSLYLARSLGGTSGSVWNVRLLQNSRNHFDYANALDSNNIMAQGFIAKIVALGGKEKMIDQSGQDSENEDTSQNRKRSRLQA